MRICYDKIKSSLFKLKVDNKDKISVFIDLIFEFIITFPGLFNFLKNSLHKLNINVFNVYFHLKKDI